MNKAIQLDAREIKQQASGRWLEIIPSIDQRFSIAAQSVGNHVPCPLGTGDKDGFRFGENAKEDGHAFSNSGAPLGDGFAVLQWANNGNFREVLEKVSAYLNNGSTKPVTQNSTRPHTSPYKAPTRPKKENQALIKQIIETASKAPTSAVKAYLESRGLSDVLNNYPEALLSHSKLAYPPNGTYPAMTGTITNLQGDVIGIQRHYLTKDGAKLDIKNHDNEPLPNKTMLGIGPKCLTGGSVKLGIPQDVVNITEGIETALAVLSATGIATWATNTAALLAKTEVPESVKTVYIWADKDRNTAGKKAAIRLADKLIREGHTVSILEPPLVIPAGQKGVDWLDVYTRSGSEPFIQAINANTQQPKKDVSSNEWAIRGECVEEDVKTINRKFTHIVTGGKNYIATIGTDAANNKMMIFYKLDEFKSMMGHYPKATIYAPSGAATKRNIGAVWLEHEDARVCYNGVTFRPVNERFYKGKLNTYFGHGVEAIEHSQEDVAPYLDHIKQIICDNNEECYQYVINWLAHMIQKPEEKPGVAIIMKSGQGTGKGMFVEPLRKIMGSHYCYADKSGMLTGRFNSAIENKILTFADDSFFGSKADTDQLKTLITESLNTIERKGIDSISVPDFNRIIMAANKDGIVSIEEDERRYLYLEVSEEQKGKLEYFTKLRSIVTEDSFASKLLSFLKDVDISNFNPRAVPKTQALTDQKINNLDPLDRWLYESLCHGENFNLQWNMQVPARELQDAIRVWMDSRSYKLHHMDLASILGRRLAKIGVQKKRVGINNVRSYRYIFPELEEARRRYEQNISGNIDW